jgi:hypothetical protein
MTQFLAFDIETHKVTPQGEDPLPYRPLGIACAATIKSGDDKYLYWYNEVMYGNPEPTADKMDEDTCGCLVDYLIRAVENGYKIVTWNGNFDFTILAEESGLWNECKELAANHIDPMFHAFCIKGFPMGLDASAAGMGLPGKTEGMSGELAPVLWQKSLKDRLKVLEYVGNDALVTLRVVERIAQQGMLKWITKRGHLSGVPMHRLMTVKEARDLPLPDTSWMPSPIPRATFYDWVFTKER